MCARLLCAVQSLAENGDNSECRIEVTVCVFEKQS